MHRFIADMAHFIFIVIGFLHCNNLNDANPLLWVRWKGSSQCQEINGNIPVLASDTFSGIIKGMFGEKPCVCIEMVSGAVHILSYVVPSGKPARRVLCLFCEEKPPPHSSLSISIVFRHKQMSSLPKGSSQKSGSKTEETDVKPQQYLTCLHALIISTLAEGRVLLHSVLFICMVSVLQYGRTIKDFRTDLIFKFSIKILLNTYMLIMSFIL